MPTPNASISKLGTVDIYLSQRDGDTSVREPIIPRINPIGSTQSILHYFGDPGQIRRLKGIVYTEAARATLEAHARAGDTVNFTNDRGSQGNFVITSISFTRRQALNYADSFYQFSCELIAQ